MLNLNHLNKEQLEAVQTIDGPLLVLAGAGSGKTRVLTYRIANLIENHGVAPWSILALTFTNKAAKEMKERTDKLVGIPDSDMWVTTFHSFCVKVLRFDIDKLGYDSRFVIYDEQDQTQLITEFMKQCSIDEKRFSKNAIKARISEAKNSSESPENYIFQSGDADGKLIDLYRLYQKKLKSSNALDFDDLLLKTVELFSNFPEVLEKYKRKFKYVLVDEYQDTNFLQYKIIKLLCSEHRNICVVGDDDQSIYGWRGADIRNILDFEKDFSCAKVIRLEQNYRSTKQILDCANKVIVNNTGRKSKALWTDKRGGEPVELLMVGNEREEAYNIAKTISDLHRREDRSFNDFAVLYRTHAQSRIIESILSTSFGIPLSIIGGTRFYARKEIKDLLAYLKLIANPNDDVSLKRIINVPKRGIGETTVKAIESAAAAHDVSMCMALLTPDMLPPRVSAKVASFCELIRELFVKRYELTIDKLTDHIIDTIHYMDYLSEQHDGTQESREENIQELIGAMREHTEQLSEGTDSLHSFLETVALNADADNVDESDGTVKLMTLHCAKGLEFPVVFLPGMETDIFPSSRSRQDPSKLEEERRLCYVGITRAKEKLYLFAARERMLYGTYQHNDPSIFLDEMGLIDPDETPMKRNSFGSAAGSRSGYGNSYNGFYGENSYSLNASKRLTFSNNRSTASRDSNSVIDEIRKLNGIGQSYNTGRTSDRQSNTERFAAQKPKPMANCNYKKFQRVRHPQFGVGTITDISGQGTNIIATIDFEKVGIKRIAAGYVPMDILSEE